MPLRQTTESLTGANVSRGSQNTPGRRCRLLARSLACLAAACVWAASAQHCRGAEEPRSDEPPPPLPLWEVGVFAGALVMPRYRGSDERSVYAMPLPYFVYRGKVLRANRTGLSGVFVDRRGLDVRLSIYGHPPVNSDEGAREGMADLGPLIEVGPAVRLYLAQGEAWDLYFSTAVRQAFAFDTDTLDPSMDGLRSFTEIVYHTTELFGHDKWSFGVRAGVDFNTSDYHDYYYGVDGPDVRPGRTAYEAPSGYGGALLSAGLTHRLSPNLSVGVYARWDNIAGTAYDDSPLVERENNYTVGAALIWKIWKSEARAVSGDDF